MTAPRRAFTIAMVLLSAGIAACGGAPPSAPSSAPANTNPPASLPVASTTPSQSGEAIRGLFEVGGANVFLECKGTGSPTVLFETGLGGDSEPWAEAIGDLEPTTRACRYDRAGIGRSYTRPGATDLSVGDRAEHLHALLDVAGVEGPYVLVGFSYGGMLIRAFADRYPEESAGLVFIDGSHEDQFVPGSWWVDQQSVWQDGTHLVDAVRSREELLAATDLGALPTIVLTNGDASGEFERRWSPLQDAIAAMSSNSLHMVATEAGHDINADRPELVVESIRAVVEAVRGTALPACRPRFESLGAECLAGTMTDLLATWDARRAAVVPAAGDLPPGAYSFKDDGATVTMTLGDGRIETAIKHLGGSVETYTAEYAAAGDEVTFVWAFDWRIPRTSGVNTARWTVDADGTIRFVQLDSELAEPWLALPWVPVAGD